MVIINKLNASRLPSSTTSPNVQLLDSESTDDQAVQEAKSKGAQSAKHLTAKKTAVSGRKVVPDFLEKPNEAQPSAMETMRMARGVTLRQGGATKAGPPRKSIPGQVTRQVESLQHSEAFPLLSDQH